MNLYFDSSALVKIFVQEIESPDVRSATRHARMLGTSLVSRAEVESALSKGVRMGNLDPEGGRSAQEAFRQSWEKLLRLPVTEGLVARAGELTWSYGLRGHDSIQLATALLWQEYLARPVTFACFNHRLSAAAAGSGLELLHRE